MAALPAEVTTGTITATMLKAVVDGVDADLFPDGVPLTGQVTFSPEIGRRGYSGELLGGGRLTVATSTPPQTIVVQPIPVALDPGGALSVVLIATDNPDIAPTGWTWTVSFDLPGVKVPPFSFEVHAGTTADLSTLAPIEISTGSALFINEAAASAASAAASAASAALSASLVGAPADTAVAAIVGDPASDTATLLSSTYAPVASTASTTAAQKDGPVFTFGGSRRVVIAEQGTTDQSPHAGMVEVDDAATSRKLWLSHYQYGGLMRQTGTNGGIFEWWLGDIPGDAVPNLSVRHNGSNMGAIIQARDQSDYSGVQLDFRVQTRPKIAVELNAALPSGTVFAIENPNAGGLIAFATNSGGGLTDRLTILNDGSIKVAGMLNSQYLTDLTNTIAYMQTDYDGTHAFALNNRTATKIPWSIRGAAAQSADLIEYFGGAAVVGGVTKDGRFRFVAGNEQTTIGAAGGASALPATPTKYLKIIDSAGTTLIIPAYAAA